MGNLMAVTSSSNSHFQNATSSERWANSLFTPANFSTLRISKITRYFELLIAFRFSFKGLRSYSAVV